MENIKAIQPQIISEIVSVLNKHGATSDIISIIASWGDTLSSEDVLQYLKEWNVNNQLPRQLHQHTLKE